MCLHPVPSYQSRHSLHVPKSIGTGRSILNEARSLLLLVLCILRLRISQRKKIYIKFCPPRRMENGLNFTFSGSSGRSSGAELAVHSSWGDTLVHGETHRSWGETPHLDRLQFPAFSAELCWTRSEQSTWFIKKKKVKGTSDLFVMPKATTLHVEGWNFI